MLLDSVCLEFRRAAKLIEGLEDDFYTGSSFGKGSIGAHFRHNVDIANNLLNGLKNGTIDYGERERDVRVEKSRQFALKRIEQLTSRLKELPSGLLEMMVAVRSDIEPRICHLSSVARELDFLHSHTVHHHAMIAEKLRSLGHGVSFDFGVAPSTLRFWSQESSNLPAHSSQD